MRKRSIVSVLFGVLLIPLIILYLNYAQGERQQAVGNHLSQVITQFVPKADLRGVDLRGEVLIEADLREADLREAIFCDTTMPDGTINNSDCR